MESFKLDFQKTSYGFYIIKVKDPEVILKSGYILFNKRLNTVFEIWSDRKGDYYMIKAMDKDVDFEFEENDDWEILKTRAVNKSMDFAIAMLRAGRMVRRSNWPEGTFIFEQIPSKILGDIIPKMTSLPLKVKIEFKERNATHLEYDDQIAIVDSKNVIRSWSCSHADLFAKNWEVYGG